MPKQGNCLPCVRDSKGGVRETPLRDRGNIRGVGKLTFIPCYNRSMKLAIILQSNNPEHAWNALRLGITALKSEHAVGVFLLSEGSELEMISDTEHFDIAAKIAEFKAGRGEIFACGTCLRMRSQYESAICPVSTMGDLLKMIEFSDKVVTF